MQIQRIQTLWLILALGCLIAFLLLPFGVVTGINIGDIPQIADLNVYDFLGLLIPVGLGILLLAIDIFSFKDLNFQRSVAVLSLMMELVSAGITVYILCDKATNGGFEWRWESAFLAGALLFTLFAIVGITRDRRLLRSYDRIR